MLRCDLCRRWTEGGKGFTRDTLPAALRGRLRAKGRLKGRLAFWLCEACATEQLRVAA